MQTELADFANYVLNTLDYSAEFEDDAFAVTYHGVRYYVERKRDHFNIHVGSTRHKLPRC